MSIEARMWLFFGLFVAAKVAACCFWILASWRKLDLETLEGVLKHVLAGRDYHFDANLRNGAEAQRLRAAIRKHRDYRGDRRCHLDDGELYAVLPEGDTRPEREVAVTIENCQKFIECRQQGRTYVSPQDRIEELESEKALLLDEIRTLSGLGLELAQRIDGIRYRLSLLAEPRLEGPPPAGFP